MPPILSPEEIAQRTERARAKALTSRAWERVRPTVSEDSFAVCPDLEFGLQDALVHLVRRQRSADDSTVRWYCDCPAAQNELPCYHVAAVVIWLEAHETVEGCPPLNHAAQAAQIGAVFS